MDISIDKQELDQESSFEETIEIPAELYPYFLSFLSESYYAFLDEDIEKMNNGEKKVMEFVKELVSKLTT